MKAYKCPHIKLSKTWNTDQAFAGVRMFDAAQSELAEFSPPTPFEDNARLLLLLLDEDDYVRSRARVVPVPAQMTFKITHERGVYNTDMVNASVERRECVGRDEV